jgi:Bacterial regulatory protein, Fis family
MNLVVVLLIPLSVYWEGLLTSPLKTARRMCTGETIDEVIDAIDRRMVEDDLKKNRWNKQKASQELGLSLPLPRRFSSGLG